MVLRYPFMIDSHMLHFFFGLNSFYMPDNSITNPSLNNNKLSFGRILAGDSDSCKIGTQSSNKDLKVGSSKVSGLFNILLSNEGRNEKWKHT